VEQAYFNKRATGAGGNASLHLKMTENGANGLKFENDRPWYFRNWGTGAAAELILQDRGSSKVFSIVDYNGYRRFQFNMNTSSPRFIATPVYSTTTTSSANVNVHTDGTVRRSTSARRYKEHIIYYGDRLADLELRPAGWYHPGDDKWGIGFIADDVAELHPALGEYSSQGVENYDHRGVMAIMAAKINRLERKVQRLEAAAL
jgi:hypothetical protein